MDYLGTIRRLVWEYSNERFIRKSKVKHIDVYDYEDSNFISYDRHVMVTCPKHGVFKVIASNHMKGEGCPTCVSGNEYKEPVILVYKPSILKSLQNIMKKHKMVRKKLGEYKNIKIHKISHKPKIFYTPKKQKLYETKTYTNKIKPLYLP